MMMSIAQRNAETVAQNQSEARMIDLDKLLELEARATPANVFGTTFWSDTNEKLTFAMRNSIKELCAELKAAREVVEASRVGSFHHPACPYFDGAERCGCSNQLVKDALKTYDEARQG